MCRSDIRNKDIDRDLLAYQIIDELDVFCTNKNKGCSWQGHLSDLPSHMSRKCNFKSVDLPNWYQNYVKSKEQELEKNDMQEEALDPKLQEALNANNH